MSKPFGQQPWVIVITGPTASGKTTLSSLIAQQLPCEIINADVGQFYTPLSIGTAKPDLSQVDFPHHLFDIFNQPEELSVVRYRAMVVDLVQAIHGRGKIPVIVGGSLFYIKSLFYPPAEYSPHVPIQQQLDTRSSSAQSLWEKLNAIDPARAQALHPRDIYRITRALHLWEQTGVLPSQQKPCYTVLFNAFFVVIEPEKKVLEKNIRDRIAVMLHQGFIEEVESLLYTPWETFLIKKNLIGYPEIMAWIRNGKKENDLVELVDRIRYSTMHYAKRQRTFWKSFKKQLDEELGSEVSNNIIMAITTTTQQTARDSIEKFLSLGNSELFN